MKNNNKQKWKENNKKEHWSRNAENKRDFGPAYPECFFNSNLLLT